MSGFNFSENRGHSVVRFEAELLQMSWGDVEKEAAEIVQQIKSTETARLIVDLTPMHLIQSGLVASLVRMWKATDGWPDRKVVVATDNEVVHDVIRSAGLLNLMKVVGSIEEATSEIKVSTEAQVEIREKRVVAWAALPVALFSVAALYPVLRMDNELLQAGARTAATLAASFACIASVFSMVKDDGYRRAFGILSMVIGLTVLGVLNGHRTAEEIPGDPNAVDAAETSPAETPKLSTKDESELRKKERREAAPEKGAETDETNAE
jgi:hypothetical protein